MTEQEELEFAAKAAGLDVRWIVECQDFYEIWNPRTDDGDALRLAVKLDLLVAIGAARDCDGRLSLDNSDDPYAATRRAIVRAAAEIGRNMA